MRYRFMPRLVPNSKQIRMFLHCRNCYGDCPPGTSPEEWQSVEVGWTKIGIQVWCRRCNTNIVHVDFESRKHPVNMAARVDLP